MQLDIKGIPTKEQNPNGLHQRYIIAKIKGNIDPKANYFVLRLDLGGSDINHIKACRRAVHTYAQEIAPFIPQLAVDLIDRFPIITTSEEGVIADRTPQQTVSAMYYDMNRAKSLLLQLKELPMFNEIFQPGEVGSISALTNRISERTEFMQQLQSNL